MVNAREAMLHDLRAPLQVIAGCVELLESELVGNAKAMEYVEMLRASEHEMRAMIENAFARRVQPMDLVSQTRELCARVRVCAARKNVRLNFESGAETLIAPVNPQRYARILANLLDNALKATASGGCIRVRIDRVLTEKCVCVTVADDGCGMDSARLSRIFEAGETTGGLGLGLPIAREYAESMGGSLTAESVLGKGSRFTLRLPAC